MMKDLLRWILLIKLAPLLRRLPSTLTQILAAALSALQYAVYPRARRIIRDEFAANLELTRPRRELAVIGSFYHHLLNDLELLIYPEIDRDFIQRRITFTGSGWNYLREHKKNAAMLVTFHFGPNQIIIPVLPLLGYSFTQMAVPPSYWDELVQGGPKLKEVNLRRTQSLESTRAHFIYVTNGIGSLRDAFRAIQRGEVLCVAGDGRIGKSRSFPFLNGSLDVALGAFYLAAKHSLPLIPVLSIRTASGFKIDMRGPFYPNDANQDEIIRACILFLESHTARFPEQYGWMYYAKAIGG